MRLAAVIGVFAALIASASQALDDNAFTTSLSVACGSYQGAQDFWQIIDKQPANVSLDAWLDTIGCLQVQAGLEVVPIEEINLVVRGLVLLGADPVEAWFLTENLVRNGEPYPSLYYGE